MTLSSGGKSTEYFITSIGYFLTVYVWSIINQSEGFLFIQIQTSARWLWSAAELLAAKFQRKSSSSTQCSVMILKVTKWMTWCNALKFMKNYRCKENTQKVPKNNLFTAISVDVIKYLHPCFWRIFHHIVCSTAQRSVVSICGLYLLVATKESVLPGKELLI